MQGLLSTLVWLPIAGGVVLLALGDRRMGLGRWLALAVAVATFVLSLQLYAGFDAATAAYQFTEQRPWIPALHSTYHLGVDGISMPLILLTTLFTVVVVSVTVSTPPASAMLCPGVALPSAATNWSHVAALILMAAFAATPSCSISTTIATLMSAESLSLMVSNP